MLFLKIRIHNTLIIQLFLLHFCNFLKNISFFKNLIAIWPFYYKYFVIFINLDFQTKIAADNRWVLKNKIIKINNQLSLPQTFIPFKLRYCDSLCSTEYRSMQWKYFCEKKSSHKLRLLIFCNSQIIRSVE